MSGSRTTVETVLAPLRRIFALLVRALEGHIGRTDLSRAQLRHELNELRDEVRQLGAASVESLGYVGRELRNLAVLLEERAPGRDRELDLIEIPFAFRSLAAIQPPSRILGVGVGGSSIWLSLASLGYDVTALDPRGVSFEHPRLEVVEQLFDDWDHEKASFDAIVCISTPEQAGLSQTDPADADERRPGVLERLGEQLRPGGLLVLTIPLGSESSAPGYDAASLSKLLAGWEIKEQTVVERRGRSTWELSANGAAAKDAVALVAARFPDQA